MTELDKVDSLKYKAPIINLPVLINYGAAILSSLQATIPAVASTLPPNINLWVQIALSVFSAVVITAQRNELNRLGSTVRTMVSADVSTHH